MNAVRNSVQLVGNLGKRPEVKHFENGNSVARFSLATSYYYLNKAGEKTQDTQWHNIVVWGKNVSFVESSLDKGNEISVKGRLTYRQYEDKNGVKHTITEIIAEEIEAVQRPQIATS